MALHHKIAEKQKKAKSIEWLDVRADHASLNERAANLDKGVVEGYAVIWGVKNTFSEIFIRGAFAKSIAEVGPNSTSPFKIKFRHEHKETIAQIAELVEDDIGLYFRTVPLDMEDDECKLVIRRLKNGTYNNFSIGFRYVWDKMVWDDVQEAYLMLEARLWEISVVGIPSDQQTYAIRSEEEIKDLFHETEDFIATLPRNKRLEARSIFAIYQTLVQNEQQEIENRSALDNTNEPPEPQQVDWNKVASLLEN